MGEHQVYHNGYKCVYWHTNHRGEISASTDTDKWTEVDVQTHGAFPVHMLFKRDDKEQMVTFDVLCRFLDKAYESGFFAAKQQLRDWLDVPKKGVLV